MNQVNNIIDFVKKIQILDQDQSIELYLHNLCRVISEGLRVDFVRITHMHPQAGSKSYCSSTSGDEGRGIDQGRDDFLIKNIISEEKKLIQVPTNFKSFYPESSLHAYTKVDSYIGYPICSEDNELQFVIELFQSKNIANVVFITDILPLVQNTIVTHMKNYIRLDNLDKANYQLVVSLTEKEKELTKLREQELEQERLASLGRDIAGIFHEMRNPLDYVLGSASKSVAFAESYKNELSEYVDDLDAQTQESLLDSFNSLFESLRTINTHSKRLFEISSVILEQSSLKSRFKEYNLYNLLSENLQYAYHSSELYRSGIKFNSLIDVPNELGRIVLSSDASSLFLNLFDNAFDSIYEDIQTYPAKPAQIEIFVSSNANDIEITIKDNGKGMDQNILSHVGEPFYTTKPSERGTGIGLAIVNQILAKNSGNMKLDSIPHKHTTFELHFPYLQAA